MSLSLKVFTGDGDSIEESFRQAGYIAFALSVNVEFDSNGEKCVAFDNWRGCSSAMGKTTEWCRGEGAWYRL